MSNFSETLISIYDVSLDNSLWDRCIDSCSAYAALFKMPKQSFLIDNEFWQLDDAVLSARPDYAYLLKNVGTLRRVAMRLNDNPTWIDSIAFQFDAKYKQVPLKSCENIKALVPHVAKTIELNRYFHNLRSKFKAVLTALDNVEIGMIITEKNGSVIIKNLEAQRILDCQDGLSLSANSKMRCAHLNDTEIIRTAIESVSDTASGLNSVSEVTRYIPRRSSSKNYIVEISPLSDACDELGSKLRGALVIIIDTENVRPINTKRLAMCFEFSGAESKVCQLVIEGNSNNIIAEMRNVSPETIKSQVSQIYRKTNTRKRSELIRLALQVSPPIRSPENI